MNGNLTDTRNTSSRNCQFTHWNSVHFRFDTETKTWKNIKHMNVARANASVIVFNGYIYVAGGRIDAVTKTKSVELYDQKSDEWIQLASMNSSRSCSTLIQFNLFLYAIGNVKAIERYDLCKNSWAEVRVHHFTEIKISKLMHCESIFRLDLSKGVLI